MTGGAHLSARRGEGQWWLEAGVLSCDGGGNQPGADAARGPAEPGEEGGSPGRSGPAWRPGLVGLISIGKNQKGFDF
jgi:hypothetical protein